MEISIITSCSVVALFWLYMIFRNEWVYHQRDKIISEAAEYVRSFKTPSTITKYKDIKAWVSERWDEYENNYYSYGKMMCYFWCWDIEKMKEQK